MVTSLISVWWLSWCARCSVMAGCKPELFSKAPVDVREPGVAEEPNNKWWHHCPQVQTLCSVRLTSAAQNLYWHNADEEGPISHLMALSVTVHWHNPVSKKLEDPMLTDFNKYIYSKTSLNRPTMGPTLNGPFRKLVGLGSLNIITMVLHGRLFGGLSQRSV